MSRVNQRGFTLLELLVALVVLGLLVATAYAGLRSAANSWERAETRIQANEDQRAVTRFLRRTFAEITPLAHVEQGAVSSSKGDGIAGLGQVGQVEGRSVAGPAEQPDGALAVRDGLQPLQDALQHAHVQSFRTSQGQNARMPRAAAARKH